MNFDNSFRQFFILFVIIVFSISIISTDVFADQRSGGVSVGAEVPEQSSNNNSGGPSGGGGGSTDEKPFISDVTTTPMLNSAIVQWQATDDNDMDKCDLLYGFGSSLNNRTTVGKSSTNTYKKKIIGLESDRLYDFRIECYDDAGQLSKEDGNFKTYKTAKIDLTIKAKPEKRVNKKGGNLGMNFNFYLIATSSDKVVYKISSTTNPGGVWKKSNISINSGKGYKAVLKGESHLAKRITGVNISDAKDLVINFSNKSVLQAGDVAGKGVKDNFIDVLDLSALHNQINTSDKEADLNRDGIVDVLDISILMKNFNNKGDELPSNIK